MVLQKVGLKHETASDANSLINSETLANSIKTLKVNMIEKDESRLDYSLYKNYICNTKS